MNDVEEIRKGLQRYVESITRKSRNGAYICPLCHSGEGRHKTGAFSITDNGKHWACFACNAPDGSGKGGDIFDLIGLVENLPDFKDQLKRAKDFLGIDTTVRTGNQKKPIITRPAERDEEQVDYSNFYLQAHEHINETDYPKKRGLSDLVISRFKLGFVKEWKHPKVQNAPATPRLIIPTSDHSYLARDVRADEEIPLDQKRYSKMKVGGVTIFNAAALKTATRPIFIVEGEIDALSIMTMQGVAIGLGSIAMVKPFLELLRHDPPAQPLILALDSDERGKAAQDQLAVGLQELGITSYRGDVTGDYKDPNEFLVKDQVGFAEAVAKAEDAPAQVERELKEAYLRTSSYYSITNFMDNIKTATPYIPTGFPMLDERLDGGLYEGLYVFGAITTLGKTTFIMQLADQVARAGNDVLIFSLEMSKYELIAKSLSRLTYTMSMETWGRQNNAKTARSITTRSKWDTYSKDEVELVHAAIKAYSNFAEHIYISEGIGDIGVPQIRKAVEDHIRFTGNRPIVIIDYLQILAPWNMRATDKQNTDKAVMELKRISRDNKIPIIGISSFNRDNYNEAVSNKSFKESGAIEYSSDVLIGLQLRGVGAPMFNIDQALLEDPREIELVILKNRNGGPRARVLYQYKPMFNYFTEAGSRKASGRKWTRISKEEETPAPAQGENNARQEALIDTDEAGVNDVKM